MEISITHQVVMGRLAKLGKKPTIAAEGAGLSRTYITDMGRPGRKGSVNEGKVVRLALACDWTEEELREAVKRAEVEATGRAMPRPKQRAGPKVLSVPLLDRVTAGQLLTPMSQIPAEKAPKIAVSGLGAGEFFALKVDGTSMDKVSPEGSIIVVNIRERDPMDGKFYVFSINGDTTYKRWNAKGQFLEPYTSDPDSHRPIIVTNRRTFRVIGRVRRTLLDL